MTNAPNVIENKTSYAEIDGIEAVLVTKTSQNSTYFKTRIADNEIEISLKIGERSVFHGIEIDLEEALEAAQALAGIRDSGVTNDLLDALPEDAHGLAIRKYLTA